MDCKFDGCFTASLSGDRSKVERLMDRISEIEQFNITNKEPESSNSTLEEGKKVSVLSTKDEAISASNPDTEEADTDSNNSNPGSVKSKNTDTKKQETIRVSTTNLDNIMNLVGELVINKGRLLQISQKYSIAELEEATGTLDKSISSLQDEVMRTRMVKIERVFSKFPRMVRDLSRKLDKNIDFEVEGQDTELDRTILDEMNDPLVHLVRNAVDHGVEDSQDRIKAGKKETGHIKLSAKREKNNVIIEIEDDGKGLDTEVIKRKAIDKGVLSPDDANNLSEDEIRTIIFLPGFSTKDNATEISGRGVGMDVVKTAVEKLGGKVRLYSKKGEYTRIRISLPPTVAIIKSLLVEVGSETYAIPISNVVKALSVDDTAYKFVKGSPLLYINDRLIPILELKETFNIQCEKLDKQIAIVVEKENEEVGLIVDSIIDQQEIVIKPLTNVFSNSTGFTGVTILGDGRVIPILDVSILIRDDIDD
jgi:two-component system chemotaxis sensor kinase CheA